MTTTLEEPLTLAQVAAIPDAEQRARAANVLWQAANTHLRHTRLRRDAACLHLLRNEGWKPVQIYRIASLSRRLFGPIAATIPSGRPAPEVQDAEAVVRYEGEEFWRAKARLAEVAEVRRKAARKMLSEGRLNVEVHTASGLSTGWVTQASKSL